MPTPANAINESTTGICGFTGTAFTSTAVTNHAVLVGGATSSTITNVGPTSTSGQVLQSAGASADPSFSTATYPATTTINQVLYSSAANTVSGLATTTNGVLATDTSGVPSISQTPRVTSITFDGTNFLSVYQEGTWTPTLYGSTSAGSTTYASQGQYGYYTKIGNLVYCQGYIAITAATGTGYAIIGGFPFTCKNVPQNYAIGSASINASGWAWPTGTTNMNIEMIINTTTAFFATSGSSHAVSQLQMTNAAITGLYFTVSYNV